MTLNSAKKLLGKIAVDLTDEELEKELEIAEFMSELLFDRYFQHRNSNQGKLANNAVQ